MSRSYSRELFSAMTPVGAQAGSSPELTRRQFMGAATATPLIIGSAPALAQVISYYDLQFELSADKSVLTVIERPIFGSDADNATQSAQGPVDSWTLPAAAFGPRCWFDMQRPHGDVNKDSAPERRVIIRQCSFGGLSSATVELVFQRDPQIGDPPRWFVSLASGPFGKSSRRMPVALHALRRNKRIAFACDASAVRSGLIEMFGGEIEAKAVPGKTCQVSLDADLVWKVQAGTRDLRLTAFEGRVILPEILFQWSRENLDGGNSPGSGIHFLGKHVFSNEQLAADFSIGAEKGHRTSFRRAKMAKPAPSDFVVRVRTSEANPAAYSAVAALALGTGAFTVASGSATLAGPIGVSDAVVTRTSLAEGQSRTVMWGDASGDSLCDQASKVKFRGTSQIVSPIGALRVGPVATFDTSVDRSRAVEEGVEPQDAGIGAGPPPDEPSLYPISPDCGSEPAGQNDNDVRRLFRAALGDRGGTSGATLFVVHDSHAGMRRISVDLALFEAAIAVPDVSYSRLTFNHGDLRLFYSDGKPIVELSNGEHPLQPASSYVWMADAGQPLGKLDLTRATLTCARDYDLMRLRFHFHDLVLTLARSATIHPARSTCRTIMRRDGTVDDNRPVLVVEFDPQHVMEEAIFLPEPPPLPDVEVSEYSRDEVLEKLRREADAGSRIEYRKKVRDAKGQSKEPNKTRERFSAFANAYETLATTKGVPDEQRIYIGPFALDADAMSLARAVQKQQKQELVSNALDVCFDSVKRAYDALNREPGKFLRPINDGAALSNAIYNESLLEQQVPFYAVFRTFWNDHFSKYASAASRKYGAESASDDMLKSRFGIDSSDVGRLPTEFLLHFFLEANIPDGHPGLDSQNKALEKLKPYFAAYLTGAQADVPDLVAGRLSGCSRLAFRVNCIGPTRLDAAEANLPGASSARGAETADGGVTYDPIPFTFEALTDWSRHEPSVTRRAKKLYNALPSGLLPPVGERASNADDLDILSFQGISVAPSTASQRLGEIRASLSQTPNELETAIEIPSRLILSTAQDAVWLNERRLPAEVLSADSKESIKVIMPSRPTLSEGAQVLRTGSQRIGKSTDIWSARLAVDDVSPSVRAVASPDLRPHAVGGIFPLGKATLPGQGAPPRGPYAPWFIGLDESESSILDAGKEKTGLSRLVKWLLARANIRESLPADDYRIFRTSLDAFDRHQIVLLTSAYGLPVTGARTAASEGDAEKSGGLVAESGQIEPGRFWLLDGKEDQAIYRPVPLAVQELSLSALGGSFYHDTTFKPAAGAIDIYGKQIFEGFSIERWQHDIVLGRDIRAEVVYKGYLFPLGHRASLVKLTERTFLRTPTQGVKAMLRQRMFLRVARPKKLFPAVGQPHGGRLFNAKVVTLLTVRTPDILDPTLGSAETRTDGEIPVAQISLDGLPGLAFWPRTDITPDGVVLFEVDCDGAKTALPLMFIDNIAATTPESLKAIVKHYNGLLDKHRTAQFDGQKLRYAPEQKPGDTSFTTLQLRLRAHGRMNPGLSTWTSDLDIYETTGVLEGDEQPPFYPAMEGAEIRIEQAERFSGGRPRPVWVQFDGHYVRHGFPEDRSPTDPALPADNPAEVFLNLRKVISLDMGANGDRGAAIGRPNMRIVAIGRRNGPLGADQTVGWDATPAAALDRASPIVRDEQFSDKLAEVTEPTGEIPAVAGNKVGLVSLARYYDPNFSRASKVPDNPPLSSDGRLEKDPKPINVGDLSNRIAVVKSYFSQDAKLLGTIRLRALMEFLGITPDNLPVLKEVVEYGTAAVQDAAANAAADVRVRILAPLLDVVSRLEAEWQAIDQRFKASLAETKVSLATLYPEVNAALKQIKNKLEAGIATEDAVALAGTLAEIYESGRRLIRAFDVIASNPVERLEDAVGAAIKRLLADVTSRIEEVSPSSKEFVDLAKAILDWRKKQPQEQLNQLEKLLEISAAGLPGLGIPRFDLPKLRLKEAIASLDLPNPPHDEWLAAVEIILADFQKSVKNAISAKKMYRVAAIAALEAVKNNEPDVEGAVKKAVEQSYANAKTDIDKAVSAAEAAINDKIIDAAAELELRAQAVLVTVLSAWKRQVLPTVMGELPIELRAIQSAVVNLLSIYQRFDAFAKAIDRGKSREILASGSELMHNVFGIDILQIAGANIPEDINTFAKDAQTTLDQFMTALGLPAEQALLKVELLVCAEADAKNAIPDFPVTGSAGSIAVLTEIGNAIVSLKKTKAACARAQAIVDGNKKDLEKFTGLHAMASSAINAVDAASTQNIAELQKLFGSIVKTIAQLQTQPGFAVMAAELSFEDRVEKWWDRARSAHDTLQVLGAQVSTALKLVQDLNAAIKSKNGFDDISSIIKQYSAEPGFPTAVAEHFADEFTGIVAQGSTLVAVSARKIVNALVAMLKVSSAFAAGPVGSAKALLSETAKKIDPALGGDKPAVEPVVLALGRLQQSLAEYETWIVVPETVSTIDDVLSAQIHNGKAVKDIFVAGFPATVFDSTARELRLVEAAAINSVQTLRARMEGLPETIRLKLWTQLIATGAFSQLEGTYNTLLTIRDQAVTRLATVEILRVAAERALLVKVEGQAEEGLSYEAGLISGIAAGKANGSTEEAVRLRREFTQFLISWREGRAAPQRIAAGVEQVAQAILRGDVLAVLDFSAYRDQLEDVIANLIPTRARLSYDFNASVNYVAGTTEIFQPQMGAPFGIKVRAAIDLLSQKPPEFVAQGMFGAFKIHLVGDLVDALELSFGGAAFELSGNAKPRFDVAYKDFTIGKDLEFAKKLQSYLTPKNGNGVFIKQSELGPGIEAGYAINLGTVSVAATSFFNVALGVSADLPFDNKDAVFKVSLGQPLNPFSMSVVPFAGSGYFAVYATANGVIGFEASFEFGGGGALGFGALSVVARVQVGVFVRIIEKVTEKGEKTRSTTLYGTFFAGGAGSIWIFSFSTSLHVRLSSGQNGEMYGEATYTFSFSLGWCDYDYSITVSRREPAIGGDEPAQGSQQASFIGFERPVRYAYNGTTVSDAVAFGLEDTTMSDRPASRPKVKQPSPSLTRPRPAKPEPEVQRPSPATTGVAVVSQSVPPLDDWDTYRSYFDESLLAEFMFEDA